HEPRSRGAAGIARARLEEAKGAAGRRRRSGHPSGVPRYGAARSLARLVSHRPMRRLILVIVLLAGVAAAVAGVYYARVDEKFQGYQGVDQFVEIAPGTGSHAIGRALVQAGIVRDEWTFRLAVFLTGTERQLKAGEYRFAGATSAKDV